MATQPPVAESGRLSERVKRGAVWGIGIDFFSQAGQIFLSLVLVRLLNPEVYGQAGLLNAVMVFVYVFSMQSFMDRALFARDSDSIPYASYWTFGVILHGILFVVVNVIAVVVHGLPKFAPIAPYLHLASFGLLLNIPRIYWTVMLQREFNWRRLRLLKMASVAFYAIVAIALAATGYGLLALVVQTLIVPIPFVIDCLFKQRHLMRFEINAAHFRDTFRFGGLRSLGNVLATGQGMLEGMVFVSVLGFTPYGVYGRAIGIGKLSSGILPMQVTTQIYPGLARLSPGSTDAGKGCALLLRLTLWISLPLALVCTLVPENVVHVLYGSKWDAVVPLLPIAMLIVIGSTMRMVLSTLVLTNIGPGRVVIGDALVFTIVAAALLWVLPYGALPYARVLAAANFVCVAYAVGLLVWRGALEGRELLRGLGAPVLAVLFVFFALHLLPLEVLMDRSQIGTLLALCLLSCTLLFYAIRLMDPEGMRSVLTYLPAGLLIRKMALLRA